MERVKRLVEITTYGRRRSDARPLPSSAARETRGCQRSRATHTGQKKRPISLWARFVRAPIQTLRELDSGGWGLNEGPHPHDVRSRPAPSSYHVIVTDRQVKRELDWRTNESCRVANGSTTGWQRKTRRFRHTRAQLQKASTGAARRAAWRWMGQWRCRKLGRMR